jgi:uncharacterized RDD family membrane protein YckC
MSEGGTGAAPAPRLKYVGFWKRLLAALIDTVILLVVILPLLLAIYGLEYLAREPTGGFAGIWDIMLQLVAPAIAVILFWKFRGATPGKMAISAKIVDAETGAAPGTTTLVVRYFAYLISILPLGLGFVWIGIDARKQGFHDKIAGTLVVYEHD